MSVFALPFTNRPDPYIETGKIAHTYSNGRFRMIRSTGDSGGGAFNFVFLDTNQEGCSGFAWPLLLSQDDMKWFKMMAEKYSDNYYSATLPLAHQGDLELNYLIMWLNHMFDRLIEKRNRGESNVCITPEDFLDAIRRANTQSE